MQQQTMLGWRPLACQARLAHGRIAISVSAGTNSEPMSVQDSRLEQTARYLAHEALEGLVAVNYGHNSFLESHAVFVLAGVRPIGESAVVVDRDGRPTLIGTPAWDGAAAASLSRTGKRYGQDAPVST